MLVSAAIQDYGMEYEKYFMLNAAVAMEAFAPTNGITQVSHDNMTPIRFSGFLLPLSFFIRTHVISNVTSPLQLAQD